MDAFHVTLAPGADAPAVRDALRQTLSDDGPALISTRAEFLEEVHHALDGLQVVIRAVVVMALIIALMGVTASLWVSVVERTRDFGVLKAIGAGPREIGAAVVWEAVVLSSVSLALAAPLGALLAWFLRARVSENYAGFHFPAAFPAAAVGLVGVAVPIVAIVAAWLPARWAAHLRASEAVAYE